MTLNEGKGHRTENRLFRPLVGLILIPNWMRIAGTVSKIIVVIVFMIKIYMCDLE